MCLIRLLLVLIVLLSLSTNAQSQSPRPSPTPSTQPSASPISNDDGVRLMRGDLSRYSEKTYPEVALGWGVLAFGILIIILEVLVMLRLKKGWGTQSIRIVGLTLVLTSGLFLIVTGYSQQQIAPMVGLLGTMTGFLLGKTSSSKEPE